MSIPLFDAEVLREAVEGAANWLSDMPDSLVAQRHCAALRALLAALPELKAALAWAEARLAYLAALEGDADEYDTVPLWREETDALMRYVAARQAKEGNGE